MSVVRQTRNMLRVNKGALSNLKFESLTDENGTGCISRAEPGVKSC